MTSNNSFAAGEAGDQPDAARAQLHDLVPFTLGTQVFAVFTDEVDAITESKPFARLPRAPNSVVGIVCVRGRMLTVIDPAALLNGASHKFAQTLPCVIALRTEEQLALAGETYRDTITISDTDIERTADASADELVLGQVTYAGERILILNSQRLFNRAVQRRDRRRRRF